MSYQQNPKFKVMKKLIEILTFVIVGVVMGYNANAQYDTYHGPNRYFYEEEFDWRWDVRVRISDGYNMGYLTRRQANRLYRRLETIERKEWAFQSDGYYSLWEQDEIWNDVVDLNRRIGVMLTDWDRPYYGYRGVVISGPLRWYYTPTYDFYRFDKRGYGSIYIGYSPRKYYPVKNVYYQVNNTYVTNWTNVTNKSNTTNRTRVESSRVTSGNRNVESSRVNPRSVNTSNGTARVSGTRTSGDRSYEGTANSRIGRDNSVGITGSRSTERTINTENNVRVESRRFESASPSTSNMERARVSDPSRSLRSSDNSGNVSSGSTRSVEKPIQSSSRVSTSGSVSRESSRTGGTARVESSSRTTSSSRTATTKTEQSSSRTSSERATTTSSRTSRTGRN